MQGARMPSSGRPGPKRQRKGEKVSWFLCVLLLGAVQLTPDAIISRVPHDLPRLEHPLTLPEAKILVTLVESAEKTMDPGFPIEWHVQERLDWYFFSAYNAGRPNPGGSVTIGHFAVNRHTAEVWDSVADLRETSPEIRVVQAILREDRHITEELLKKWEHEVPTEASGERISTQPFTTRSQ
jgi:hypothetical protein